MLELDTGRIVIDGQDISQVPREELRKRLNTLPQEPFFLQGSVRENVDPLGLTTDERMIDTLRTVQLWDMLVSRGGLDATMSEDALSHGQRQLFCLARAIARPGNIVIIDEATSRYEYHNKTHYTQPRLPVVLRRFKCLTRKTVLIRKRTN